MTHTPADSSWCTASAPDFWRDIARTDHMVQLYENEGILIDLMTGFVTDAIEADENVLVVATYDHLNALEDRMESYGMDIEKLVAERKFIPLNVDEVIAEFMINGQIDEEMMNKTFATISEKTISKEKKFRMLGEMSAILLKQGHIEAVMKIESTGNDFCRMNAGNVCCVYPKKLFNDVFAEYSLPICCTHTKLISGTEKQLTHVHYQDIHQQVAV